MFGPLPSLDHTIHVTWREVALSINTTNETEIRATCQRRLAIDRGMVGSQDFQCRVHDENVVWWDGDNDPENPHNWPHSLKWANCTLISLLTFIEPLGSSIFSPGIALVMKDFKSSNTELAAFVISVYVLGFAFGPMVLAPLSEMVGRVPVYHGCNVLFIVFTIACAKTPSLASLIVFRFLAGTFGATAMTNGGGSIADMFTAEERAGVMAILRLGL